MRSLFAPEFRGAIFAASATGYVINTTGSRRRWFGIQSRTICLNSRLRSKRRSRRPTPQRKIDWISLPKLENLAEAADAFVDFALVETRVAEDEGGLRGRLKIAVGDSVDADAAGCGFRDDCGFGDALLRPEYDVRAGAVAGDFDARAEIFVNGFDDGVAAGRVSVAQAAQMALVHS